MADKQTTANDPDVWRGTSVLSRRWITERLVRSFMEQGFLHDEAWRRATLLVEDQNG